MMKGDDYMENWYSVAELAEETGIPEPSIRRYLTRFSIYVVSKGGTRARKYDASTIRLLKRVKSLYDSGHETEGIKKLIKNEFPLIMSDQEKPETAENIDVPRVTSSEDIANLEKNIIAKIEERFAKQEEVLSLMIQKLEQREQQVEQKERQLEERERLLLEVPEKQPEPQKKKKKWIFF